MAENILFGTDYHDKFQALEYLKRYYGTPAGSYYTSLGLYHEVFQSLPAGLRVLDYGCGPSIRGAISAATKASEIVLSDYTEDCRTEVRQWLEKDPNAFDWSHYFSHVVKDLEGKGEKEVEERQEEVRRLVKAVVHCDLTQDPPIERGYDQQYDVVMSSLCIDAVAGTREEYVQGVKKLAKLVKPGGILLLFGVEIKGEEGFYVVGEKKFRAFGVSSDVTVKAMTDSGISGVDVQMLKIPESEKDSRLIAFVFIQGIKESNQ